MWDSQIQMVGNVEAQKYKITRNRDSLSYSHVIELWLENESFRTFFNELLVASPFAGFRWETPPLMANNSDRDFEFVLLRCDGLDRAVDRYAFSEHFNADDCSSVVTFSNLGKDAILVVPRPVADDNCYGHLAAFLRTAPKMQVHELWKSVGLAMKRRLDSIPVWLSTAGMGVAWLHVRLDNRPKYYAHTPYRQPPVAAV